MILQALTEYYEVLQKQGKAAAPGWGPVKVSYTLYLGEGGTLERVASIQTEQQRGKKTVPAPQIMSLPAPEKRTVGVVSNFLCDNSSYMLGVDGKGRPQRALECFAACKSLHEKVLSDVDTPAARAVLAFFQSWQPEAAPEHPALAEYWEDILSGANLTFRYDGGFVHDDPAIRRAWERHYGGSGDDGGTEMVCLVTGEKGPVENTHPSVKGVQGAQSSGAALVSFNAPAFCSYGREQNRNAPTSKAAAFAYTTALNYLLSDREHVYRMGDATVVFWAKSGEAAYQSTFGSLFSDTYYSKNPNKNVPKEVLTVSLNEASTSIPYTLGRLFSVLEEIQQKANPGINSTIKDKYFNSASATPAVVFPTLVNLAQKHLKKLEAGWRISYEKKLQGITDKLGEEYPARLTLPQQGAFQLGYYHQTQARYEKKEEK